MSSDKRPAVGLDFGTSTTLVASPNGVVPIGESQPWMPSVVGFDDSGAPVAGEPALDLPGEQAIRSVKRTITDGRAFVRLDTPTGSRDVRADDLIAGLIREAARRAGVSGQDMAAAGAIRLGCPAMWDGRQRRRLVEAAQQAGLPVTLASLVDEPVAAGIAWLARRSESAGHPADAFRAVVFDMGGGTLDVAVLDVHGDDVSVLAAIGVPEAGDALDDAIAEDLEYALAAVGVDIDSLQHPRRARARLPYAARAAKIELSSDTETYVKLPRREFGLASLRYRREQLDEVFAPQMERAEMIVGAALRAARLTEHVSGTAFDIARTPLDRLVEAVDVVVLSGGMSQIPYVRQRLADLFPSTTRIETASTPSENAVAVGLAKASDYGRINMYRPAFDIVLEWDEGRETRRVYEAYTPLVEVWQIVQGSGELCFTRTGADLSLPQSGKGRLRVVSHAGAPVRATLGGGGLDGFAVAMNARRFEFSIYPNGRLRLTDDGGTYSGRIDGWHAVPGLDTDD